MFIHGIPEIGGAERELLAIVERLTRSGYCPAVVGPKEGALAEELAHRQVRLIDGRLPPWRKFKGWFQRSGAVRRLREVIEAEQPSLVHVNDFWWVPQTLRATRQIPVPVIAHVRQEIQPWKVQRYDLDQADLVFAVSGPIRRSLEAGGAPREKLDTLYSGLDGERIPTKLDKDGARRRLGFAPDVLLIGTVANLFPRKGYEIIIPVLPELVKALPTLHYLIVGGGDAAYEQRLRRQVWTLGLEAHVHFVGFQANVYPYLAALDVYVHPAQMEGFGIAVLEAMAMGKPVVATEVGGLPEIVLEGETGYLTPPGDAPAVAKAALVLLRDQELRDKLGEAGRRRVLTVFTMDAMMGRLLGSYGRLVPGHGMVSLSAR